MDNIRVNNFTDYLLQELSEKVRNDSVALVISDRLRGVLLHIDHPIARDIIKMSDDRDLAKVSYVDIDDSNPNRLDLVSFIVSSKAIELILKKNGWDKEDVKVHNIDALVRSSIVQTTDLFDIPGRASTKIGKIVKKIFGSKYKDSGEPGEDIESFVNMYKAARNVNDRFEVVSGEDIRYWYREDRYAPYGGTLNSSCMRHIETQKCLDLYVDNPSVVSLLILKDLNNDRKIIGRALLWKLERPNGRIFMDRIYTTDDYLVDAFKEYSKKNGYFMKSVQSYDEETPIIDAKLDDVIVDTCISVLLEKKAHNGGLPYMDTMKYLDDSKLRLSNRIDCLSDSDSVWKLTSTSCGYEEACEEWSEYYQECIDTDDMCLPEFGEQWRYYDDCIYIEYYQESAARDFAENNMVCVDLHDEWDSCYRLPGDVITTYEGHTTDDEYADENMRYSNAIDRWTEDPVYSNHMEDYLPKSIAVKVCLDENCAETDYVTEEVASKWKTKNRPDVE